jgi:hypothetical protein
MSSQENKSFNRQFQGGDRGVSHSSTEETSKRPRHQDFASNPPRSSQDQGALVFPKVDVPGFVGRQEERQRPRHQDFVSNPQESSRSQSELVFPKLDVPDFVGRQEERPSIQSRVLQFLRLGGNEQPPPSAKLADTASQEVSTRQDPPPQFHPSSAKLADTVASRGEEVRGSTGKTLDPAASLRALSKASQRAEEQRTISSMEAGMQEPQPLSRGFIYPSLDVQRSRKGKGKDSAR